MNTTDAVNVLLVDDQPAKLLAYERFRSIVERDSDGAHWRIADDFDLRRHVVREKLKRRRGQSERAAHG